MTVQNNSNNKKEKKGGILGWLSSLFRGGGSTVSSLGQAGRGAGYMLGRSAASGFGKFGFGGLASIFGSKAGLLGALLGMATIAAGIAVVYNFMGGSGKSLYGPNLFRNQYYQSMMDKADKDFAARRGAAAGQQSAASSLDYAKAAGEQYNAFSQQAQSADAPKTEDDSSASSADDNSASSMADALMKSAGKLQPGTGLSGSGKSAVSGGSLGGGGGMSGGIGSGFQGIYRPGSMNAMNAAGQGNSVARNAAKRSIGRYNRRGAYAQAKSVKRLLQATKGGDMETAKAGMVNAYETGRTPSDSGAITPGGAGYGTGLGYAPPSATSPSMDGGGGGNSGGSGSGGGGGGEDPGTIPYEEDPDDGLNELLQQAGIAALLAIALTMVANWLSKSQNPYTRWLAVAVAALACVAALDVIYCGYQIKSEYEDSTQGVMLMVMGAVLTFFAGKALLGAIGSATDVQSGAVEQPVNGEANPQIQNMSDQTQMTDGQRSFIDNEGLTADGSGGYSDIEGNTYSPSSDGGMNMRYADSGNMQHISLDSGGNVGGTTDVSATDAYNMGQRSATPPASSSPSTVSPANSGSVVDPSASAGDSAKAAPPVRGGGGTDSFTSTMGGTLGTYGLQQIMSAASTPTGSGSGGSGNNSGSGSGSGNGSGSGSDSGSGSGNSSAEQPKQQTDSQSASNTQSQDDVDKLNKKLQEESAGQGDLG